MVTIQVPGWSWVDPTPKFSCGVPADGLVEPNHPGCVVVAVADGADQPVCWAAMD
jgi:hypothetical protein